MSDKDKQSPVGGGLYVNGVRVKEEVKKTIKKEKGDDTSKS